MISDNELVAMRSLYDQNLTLSQIGDIYSKSRQRVHQLLVRGAKRGLFMYPPTYRVRLRQKKVRRTVCDLWLGHGGEERNQSRRAQTGNL